MFDNMESSWPEKKYVETIYVVGEEIIRKNEFSCKRQKKNNREKESQNYVMRKPDNNFI